MSSMPSVLLLDFDHTLYPAGLPTLKAVDDRITLYIQTHLDLPFQEADQVRLRFCEEYGTTLRGLELRHGVDRDHYCDYIHAIEPAHLPPPDPALHAWLGKVPHPTYIFTNARMDWAVRGLRSMGLEGLLPEEGLGAWADHGRDEFPGGTAEHPSRAAGEAHLAPLAPLAPLPPWTGPRLQGILDIAYMDWLGKPHEASYAKTDRMLRKKHGENVRIHFADDRPDNLMAAKAMGWSTLWVTPEPDRAGPFRGSFDVVASALTDFDPERLAAAPGTA